MLIIYRISMGGRVNFLWDNGALAGRPAKALVLIAGSECFALSKVKPFR